MTALDVNYERLTDQPLLITNKVLFAFSVTLAGHVKYGLEATEELGFLRLQLCEKEHFLQVLHWEPKIE